MIPSSFAKNPSYKLHISNLRRFLLLLVILVLISLSILSGCLSGPNERFLGEWQRSDDLMRIQFKDDHQGLWKTRNDTDSQWDAIDFLFTIDSDHVLTLSAKDPGNDFGKTLGYDFCFNHQEKKILVLVIDGLYWAFRTAN